MKNKKDVKLYNVLFPFWMIMLIPTTWFIVIPGNFLIDSLVLLIAMKLMHIESKKQFYWKHIWKIFVFGIISDLIGSALLFLSVVLEFTTMGDELYITIPAMIVSSICIYLFNYCITFRKDDRDIRFKMALTFAIVTAPYTFLIPSSWLY
jgi:hypothetical protein